MPIDLDKETEPINPDDKKYLKMLSNPSGKYLEVARSGFCR
jgi:hypothetical protein